MHNKVYAMLGLAAKARKLASGDETCEKSIKAFKAKLVIVSVDASENTQKKFIDMCKYRNVEIRFYGEKQLLGKHIGKDVRSVVSILDNNFAKRILELIDVVEEQNGGGVVGEN